MKWTYDTDWDVARSGIDWWDRAGTVLGVLLIVVGIALIVWRVRS